MSANEPLSERTVLARAKRNLEREGYTVALEPEPESLPEFLRGFRPDAIAHRGDEHVVIEVKSSAASSTPHHLRALADEIIRHPGWRLQIVLAGYPDEEKLPLPERLTPADIQSHLSSARQIFSEGARGAALLLLWSVLEAVACQKLAEIGVDRRGPLVPISMLKDLTSFGFMEQEQYDRLKGLVSLRNAAAHGNPAVSIDKVDFDYLDRYIRSLSQQSALAEAT